jgi:Cu-processing system permease protein
MTPGLVQIRLCAQQELRLSVRSRWTQLFAAVFAVLALAVAASGYVLSGGSGMQDFSRTAASLLQLVLLLVPIIALISGVMAFTPDIGAAELLFSQPVRRRTILLGKLMGQFLALAAAQAIGFGAAGLLLFSRSGAGGLSGFIGVAAGSMILTALFLTVAAAISAGETSRHRGRGLAIALIVWFVAVVLFDIAALGVASMLPSGPASRLLMTGAVVNPVDAIRTGLLLVIEGTSAFGGASLAFLRFTGGTSGAAAWLTLSILGWIALLLFVAHRRLQRADI